MASRPLAAPAWPPARRRERRFYTGMAVAIVLTVFAGFSRTYYLKPYFGTPALSPLLHVHGLVFTSWLALFFAQVVLVAAHRTGVHRRLGVAGGALAALVAAVGVVTAVVRAKQGAAPPGFPPLAFLAIPLTDMLVFSSLVGAGFYFRRRTDTHKRLMLLATIAVLPAAIARLPFELLKAGPPAFFGLTDLFVVACVLYDLAALGRVHSATIGGALVVVLSQPLRLMVAGTSAWLAVATWLTGLAL